MKKLIENIKDRAKGKIPLLGKSRSPDWPEVRKAFLSKNESCAACGGTNKLQVHHIKPFHMDPSKELDEDNLITLCEGVYKCHLKIGHLGNFRKENPSVRDDAAQFLHNISSQSPRA